MTWIQTIDPDDAEGRLAELYAASADPRTGAVDNIMRVHALHPAGLEAHLALYTAVLHFAARVVGGTGRVRKTFQIYAYSSVANLLMFIPVVGGIIALCSVILFRDHPALVDLLVGLACAHMVAFDSLYRHFSRAPRRALAGAPVYIALLLCSMV